MQAPRHSLHYGDGSGFNERRRGLRSFSIQHTPEAPPVSMQRAPGWEPGSLPAGIRTKPTLRQARAHVARPAIVRLLPDASSVLVFWQRPGIGYRARVGRNGMAWSPTPSLLPSAARSAVRSSQGYSVVPKHIDCSWPLPQAITRSPLLAAMTA